MKQMLTLTALLCSSLLATPVLHAQDAQKALADTETATNATLVRKITLADLGFGGSTTFSQLSGEQEVFFPLPTSRAVQDTVFVLTLDHAARTDTPRFLMVEVAGQIVTSIDLRTIAPRDTVEVPVDRDLAQGGFLPIRLVYSGALTGEECYDTRASGDFITISSESHLRLSLDRDAVDTAALIAALQPRDLAVSLPGVQADSARIAAAARMATVFGAESGLVTFGVAPAPVGDLWSTGLVTLDDTNDAGARAAALAAGRHTGRPMLTVSGNDPQRAVAVLASPWSKLAGTGGLATDGSTDLSPSTRYIAFESLGFDPRPKRLSGSTAFEFNFDIADIPRGTRPDSISLHVAAAPDGEDEGATLVAYLNDDIVGSHFLSDGNPTWVDFDLTAEDIRRNNRLQVEFLRQPKGGPCSVVVQGFPVQVLPDSRLNLGGSSGENDDFFDIRQEMQDGIDLVVDPSVSLSSSEMLAHVAPILGSVVPGKAEIDAVANLDPEQSERPFIVVSDTAPDGSNPRLRLDEGLVELRSAAGDVLFNGTDLSRLSLVQIIDIGSRRGLWVRVGTGAPPQPTVRRPLILDTGDVAVVGEDGLMIATRSSRRDVVRVSYLETRMVTQFFQRYWALIVGIGWAILTITVLGVLQRQYRKRKADSSE